MVKSELGLVAGRKIHCILYGGRDGVIVAVHGQPGMAPVKVYGGILHTGGSAHVDVVWSGGSQSNMVPESIVHGVQWKLYDEIVSPEAVAAARANAAIYTASEKAKAEEQKVAFEKAKAAAKALGVVEGLIPEADFKKRGSAAAYNLRLELKKVFGIKARVKQDGYSTIYVKLAAASTPEQIEAAKDIGLKYKAGHFNGMEDIYEFSPGAWGSVFGDVQYVFVDVDS